MDFITVKVGILPGKLQEIALNGQRDVRTALVSAGLKADGYEIRVGTRVATLDTTLENGDSVLLAKKIRGAS